MLLFGTLRKWTDDKIRKFAHALRADTKPILVAANKADLCPDPGILGENSIPCSAETELILRKAASGGLVEYAPGGKTFDITNTAISPPQRKALNVVESVLSKLGGTGIQDVLDAMVFKTLGLITAYPVEDETRLTDKDGHVLPDVFLLPQGSTAKDLAAAVHTDLAKGFLYGINCKTRQRIGATYAIQDGDVIKIVSTAGRS